MKRLLLLIILLSSCALAEHVVEHGGRKIVTFDVPEVEYQGTRTGKFTRTFFSSPVGSGNLKITVQTKGWLSEEKAEERYRDDKTDKREDHYARLHEEPEIPGALKAITYSSSSPYFAKAVVVYTKDFRCELMVTGTEEAAELINPTFQKLLKTLQVVPRTKIGDVKVGD